MTRVTSNERSGEQLTVTALTLCQHCGILNFIATVQKQKWALLFLFLVQTYKQPTVFSEVSYMTLLETWRRMNDIDKEKLIIIQQLMSGESVTTLLYF